MEHDEDDELPRRVAAAYDEVLEEPVPQRLSKLLEPKVADFSAEREKRRPFRQLTWAQLGGIAASLFIGVLLGTQVGGRGDAWIAARGGRIEAQSELAHALETKLASDPQETVTVGLSFVDRAGRYCRTFDAGKFAGLACQAEANRWSIVAAAESERPNAASMRMAASALPKPVLDAVDARIEGSALDAQQERAARDRGWKR